MTTHVLIHCTHNSARSVLSERMLKRQPIGYRTLQLLQLPLATLSNGELQRALVDIGKR